MKKKICIFSTVALLALATPALAAITTFRDLVNGLLIDGILAPLVPLLISLAVIVFLYGVITIVISEGEKKEEGKKYMFWGIIGLFVMVSIWGLVAIVQDTFQLDNNPSGITTGLGTGGSASPINNFNARDANGNLFYNYQTPAR